MSLHSASNANRIAPGVVDRVGAAYDVLDDQGHDVDPGALAARLSSFLGGDAQRFT